MLSSNEHSSSITSGIVRCQNREKLLLADRRTSILVIEKSLFGNETATFVTHKSRLQAESGPIKNLIRCFCFSCLTLDGYQLNTIEITGFSPFAWYARPFESNWIKKNLFD